MCFPSVLKLSVVTITPCHRQLPLSVVKPLERHELPSHHHSFDRIGLGNLPPRQPVAVALDDNSCARIFTQGYREVMS
ncbi:hypothetical protein V6N13_104647 [Hibiscus sabdariffa]